MRVRAGLPVAGERAHDDRGVVLAQRLVAETEPVHHARREVLEDHVRLSDQAQEQLLALGIAQVHLDRALPGVALGEVRAVVPVLAAGVVAREERDPRAVRVIAVLDLDHVRSEVGEDARHERPDPDVGEVQHAHALEEAHLSPLPRVARAELGGARGAERGRGPSGAQRSGGQLQRRADHVLAVGAFEPVAALAQVPVREQVGDARHHREREVQLVRAPQQLRRGVRLQVGPEQRIEVAPAHGALAAVVEQRVVHEVRPPDQLRDRSRERALRRHEREVPVLAGHDVGGVPAQHPRVEAPPQRPRPHVEREAVVVRGADHLVRRDIDETGALADARLREREERGDPAHQPREVVGDLGAERDRLAVRRAAHVGDAGQRLVNHRVGAPAGARPGHPEVADRDAGCLRETLAHRVLVVERQQTALAPVADEQLAAADQFGGDRGAVLGVEVEHDAALAAVEVAVQPAAVQVGRAVRLALRERSGEAHRIALGWLDADHLRAELSEQLRRVGNGDAGCDLDDADAGQDGGRGLRSRHRRSRRSHPAAQAGPR